MFVAEIKKGKYTQEIKLLPDWAKEILIDYGE